MIFTGPELAEILSRSTNEIELRNLHGRCCRKISGVEALSLDSDLFVGIGNLRAHPFSTATRVPNDPQRPAAVRLGDLRTGAGKLISPPKVREHRPISRCTK